MATYSRKAKAKANPKEESEEMWKVFIEDEGETALFDEDDEAMKPDNEEGDGVQEDQADGEVEEGNEAEGDADEDGEDPMDVDASAAEGENDDEKETETADGNEEEIEDEEDNSEKNGREKEDDNPDASKIQVTPPPAWITKKKTPAKKAGKKEARASDEAPAEKIAAKKDAEEADEGNLDKMDVEGEVQGEVPNDSKKKKSSKKKAAQESDTAKKPPAKKGASKDSTGKQKAKKAAGGKKDGEKKNSKAKAKSDKPSSKADKPKTPKKSSKAEKPKSAKKSSGKGDKKKASGFEDSPAPSKSLGKKGSLKRKREDAESGAPQSKKKKKTCSRVIALSALDPVDRDIIESVANTLGDAEVVHEMTGDVTHVVVGEMKRTFKVLSALAQGLWIVNMDWITAGCLPAQKWVDETDYELTEWFPGARLSRTSEKKRQLLEGKKFFVNGKTQPAPEDIAILIMEAGGEVVQSGKECDVCISTETADRGSIRSPVVSTEWLFDALMNHHVPPVE